MEEGRYRGSSGSLSLTLSTFECGTEAGQRARQRQGTRCEEKQQSFWLLKGGRLNTGDI